MDDRQILLNEDHSNKLALLNMNGKLIIYCNIGADMESTLEYLGDRQLIEVQNVDFSNNSLDLCLSDSGSFKLKLMRSDSNVK